MRYYTILALLFAVTCPAEPLPDMDTIDQLDLATACRAALGGNPTLEAAGQRIEQARARLSGARARYWPRLSLSAGATQIDRSQSTYQPGLGPDNPEVFYQAGAQASWVLFDGFARRFQIAVARHGRSEAQAAEREARRLILSAVTEAFLNAQLASANVAIAQSDQAFNERLLKEAESRRTAGSGSLGDELNFRVRANAAHSVAITAENNRRLALIGLAMLMGLPQGELPEHVVIKPLVRGAWRADDIPPFADLVRRAEMDRPDLAQATAALARNGAARGAARADYYPSIALSAAVDGERADNIGFGSEDFGTMAGVGLSFDLFDGGARRAGLRESSAAQAEAVAQLRDVRLGIAGEIRSAVATLGAAAESIDLQDENAALAQRNRDLAEKEYRAGQAPLVRLNEAQRDLSNALARQVQAFIALHLARNDLQTATGTIVDDYHE